MAKSITVFISHSWSYYDEYLRLKTLLESRGYFPVTFEEASLDQPINSPYANYIRQRLKQKISNSDIVLCIAGVYASYSEWMCFELDSAIELRKPIIGIVPWGAERVSAAVKLRANVMVNWNTESIVSAIRSYC